MKSRLLIFAAVIVGGFLLPVTALAGPSGDVEFYRASGSTVVTPLWGGNGNTQQQALAQVVTMQSSRWLCSVGVRMTRASSAYTDALKLSMYQVSDINTVPTNGTLVGWWTIPEASMSVSTTPANEDELFFNFDNCMSLQASATYAFTFQRLNATSDRPYYADYRTATQYTYSDMWDYIGVDGGWQQISGSGSGTGGELHFSMQGFVPGESGTPLIFGSYSSGSATGEDLGVFGNALRDGFSYLFIPNEAAQNAWTNFTGALTVRIPFSYISEMKDIVDDMSVASGSMPAWTYTDGLVGSVSFFSYETVTQYLPVEVLALLRDLFVFGLYWAFVVYVYNHTRGLFG